MCDPKMHLCTSQEQTQVISRDLSLVEQKLKTIASILRRELSRYDQINLYESAQGEIDLFALNCVIGATPRLLIEFLGVYPSELGVRENNLVVSYQKSVLAFYRSQLALWHWERTLIEPTVADSLAPERWTYIESWRKRQNF